MSFVSQTHFRTCWMLTAQLSESSSLYLSQLKQRFLKSFTSYERSSCFAPVLLLVLAFRIIRAVGRGLVNIANGKVTMAFGARRSRED